MPQVSERHLRALRPYLVGNGPDEGGEWAMHCPLHGDAKRSASLNVLSGAWYCHGGCGGGGVLDLIRQRSRWVPPGEATKNGYGHVPSRGPAETPITEGLIAGWHSALMTSETHADWLITERGIHTKTLAEFQIGWDASRRCYTIPVRGPNDVILNIRRYSPDPGRDTKIWSVKNMQAIALYPYSQLEANRIVIGEGEWDVLATIQHGFPAITRTASVKTWKPEWNRLFKDKEVFIAHDTDDAGDEGTRVVARGLSKIADVRVVTLPFEHVSKHGQDLTDFWLQYDRADFESLLSDAQPWRSRAKTDPSDKVITVLDSFDSQRVAEAVTLQVTIKGKREPGYSIPRKAVLSCTRDRGTQCTICPLNPAGGKATVEIEPSSPAVLGLIDSTINQVGEAIRMEYGALKCPKLEIEITEHQAVEVLFARPSIDHSDGTQARDYKNIKITSVGRHDSMPNNTVLVTGALHPSPRDQRNEFLAWDIQRQETSVDHFEVTPASVKLMSRFQPRAGQTPLKKLAEINRAFALHVTKIIGRPEMHALMDLTFHSVLSFKFGGKLEHRGWIESLVVGDTRTGKSEAAERLVRHFGAGEVVGGEAATIAGLVGGLQQIGGKDWAVTWGVIPLNDRRIVVIDELSGLHPEDIAKMSDIRASGMARLTKIQQEVTYARTRLLWLGNPRHGGMDQFTYGVDAIRPLVGNPEDIARFDLAMAVAKGDVPAQDYNKRLEGGELKYTSEACHTLLMWVWTRTPDQIVWTKGAEDLVYKLAMEMGARYVEDPPLVQAANIRVKIARAACAIAARLFSTDRSSEKVVVEKAHVQAAHDFLNILYEMPSFGYEERSHERIQDRKEAEDNRADIRRYLLERRGLAKFMRSNGRFRRQDLEEVVNVDRDGANAIINKLWESRMVSKQGQDVRVEPTLHELLREARW